MPPPIPDRWIPYKACGRIIEGTRIVCFKVPLHKKVQQGIHAIKQIWDIKALIDAIPKLGAVVDLTNTKRYYNPTELKAAGLLYKKILMPGRMIPPEDKVKEFMDTIDNFMGKDGDIVIGVHCTHGLNRTGYMVCRYMRDRLNIPAKDAIKQFEKARGYKIERENFINDLLGAEQIAKVNQTEFSHRDRMSYQSPLNQYDDEYSSNTYSSSRQSRPRGRYNPYQGSQSRSNKKTDTEGSYDYKYDY